MTKYELAGYLVNLHTLISAQTSSVHNPSVILVTEYNRVWAQLKEEITNDEAGNKREPARRPEAGTDQQRS